MTEHSADYGRVAQPRHVLAGDLNWLEYAIADYVAKWGEHFTGRPYMGEFGVNVAGIPTGVANMAMTVIRKNILTSWSEDVAVPIDGRALPDASTAALVAVVAALHRPMDEEVEVWADGEDPDEHDRRFPECQDCEGHTYTMQVCQECGYTHNGETPAYRPWPCATLRAAHIDGSDDA